MTQTFTIRSYHINDLGKIRWGLSCHIREPKSYSGKSEAIHTGLNGSLQFFSLYLSAQSLPLPTHTSSFALTFPDNSTRELNGSFTTVTSFSFFFLRPKRIQNYTWVSHALLLCFEYTFCLCVICFIFADNQTQGQWNGKSKYCSINDQGKEASFHRKTEGEDTKSEREMTSKRDGHGEWEWGGGSIKLRSRYSIQFG